MARSRRAHRIEFEEVQRRVHQPDDGEDGVDARKEL